MQLGRRSSISSVPFNLTHSALLTVLATLLASAPAFASNPPQLAPEVLARGLDMLARTGGISAEEHAALAARAGITSLLSSASIAPQRCGTVEFAQVRRWVHAQGVQPRYQPAPAPTQSLTSSKFPITVNYRSGEQSRAQNILTSAEAAWQHQIIELGYPVPYTLDPASQTPVVGMVYGTDDSHDYQGVTIPSGDVPQTPRCDCSCSVIISSITPETEVHSTVAHEFNHTTQFATDCAESISAFENFATAVEFTSDGRKDQFTQEMIHRFQDFPEYPVDYWTQNMYDSSQPDMYYQYGASLFPLFLLDRYGQGDPAFLRKVWDSFGQDGSIVFDPMLGSTCSADNSPNWFQGIDATLAPQGADFKTAFSEFAAWRAIVGRHADTKHFVKASTFNEPSFEKTFSLESDIDTSSDAHEYGSRYFVLSGLANVTTAMRVRVEGDATASWSASVLLWSGGTAEVKPLVFDGAVGTLQIDSLAGITRAVVTVSQLQDDSHSPDQYDYDNSRTFRLRVTAVEPSQPSQDSGGDSAGSAHSGGCSAGPAAGAALLPELALALAFAFGRRQRRN